MSETLRKFELIEKGEMNREEGKSLVQELLTEKKKQMQELGDRISEDVQNAVDRSKIATKDDVARLEEKIAGLETAVKELSEK